MPIDRRLMNVLIAVDQLVYVLITIGVGYPDETLSSAAYRMERKGRFFGRLFRPLIDWLFVVFTLGRERHHCERSYFAELQRLQLPIELRVGCRSEFRDN